jgi:hypothetical protein
MVETGRGGVRLRVRLAPNARSEGFNGLHTDAEGMAWLKASVRAVAEGGKANAALVALLARTTGIARGRIELVSGHSSRAKVLLIRHAVEAEIALIEGLARG